ncbi:MAG: CBS domain-containing protein [Spirochaetales bacterium]|nr:CBS domain-containing protein [Spirochaetales bacterium]
MRIEELLEKKGLSVETINIDEKLISAIKIMNEKHIGALITVEENGDIAGIISERDLLMVCSDCAPDKTIKDQMTPKSKLITLKMEDTLRTAMKIFTEKKIRHLPVLKGEKLAGIISIGDVVKELLDVVEEENKYLKEYVMGQNN